MSEPTSPTDKSMDNSYHALGQACSLLGVTPARLERAAKALRINPPLKLDGVPYFRDEDIEALREQLRKTNRKTRTVAL